MSSSSNAAQLASVTSGEVWVVDGSNARVGVNTEVPSTTLDVIGVCKATSYRGDGSGLTNLPSSGLANVVEDTTPQLGGNLDLNNKDVTGIGNINITGNTTVTGQVSGSTGSFSSNVSGVDGSFTGNLSAVNGTFTGNLSVAGTVTKEDVTNVDSIGIVTARTGVIVPSGGINVTGVSTFNSDVNVTGAVAGYDYLRAPFSATVNFSVTVAAKTAAHRYNGSGSSNGYVIDGVESPFLTLTPGRTYRFTLSSGDMTSHPFRFYLEADKTTEYTTNVTSTATYTEIVVTDSTPQVLHYQCSSHSYMGNAVNTNSNAVFSSETAMFRGGLVEKYENAGTTLGAQPNNPLSDGNIILFSGNESGNNSINFTGVHSKLSSGESVSFTVIVSPNNSSIISVVQIDGVSITVKWSGGSAPTAGSSGQDVYSFQILKTGTGTSDYTIFGQASNFA